MSQPIRLMGATALLALAFAQPASATTYRVDPEAEGTELRFHSEATLESFGGTTSALAGEIAFDPADLTTLTATVTADLRELDTGIGLRNRHMRDNVLHTDEFPTAVFTVESCDTATWDPGSTLTAKVTGRMQVHGVEQRLEADVVVARRDDGNLELTATFPIRLTDFGMKRPKMLMMKVAELVDVEVRIVARPDAD